MNSTKQFNKRMVNMTKGIHAVVMGSPERPMLSQHVLEDIQARLDHQVLKKEPKSDSRNNSLQYLNQTASTLATGTPNQTSLSVINPMSGASSPNSMRNTSTILDVSQSVMMIPTKKKNR